MCESGLAYPIRLTLATDNRGKLEEIRAMLPGDAIHVQSMREAGFKERIDETGRSFAENALIKARAVHQKVGGWVLADDSGLCVAALDGYPGIHSARFAGTDADYPTKIRHLLKLLRNCRGEQRAAAFACTVALIAPDGTEKLFVGELQGVIADEPRGEHGFGYDPIFLLPERGLTTAELPEIEKNRISHRGQAIQQVIQYLLDLLDHS